LHLAAGRRAKLVEQRRLDTPRGFFPTAVRYLYREIRILERRRPAGRSQLFADQSRPCAPQARDNPFAVPRRAMMKGYKHPEQLVQFYFPG
jgi:hypothetical protein